MFQKVRSNNIAKKIISFINFGKKLRLFTYNKKYKKIFGIKLVDYINLSGKYVVGEINGKGKEYSFQNNKLIFEGDYFKGKEMVMEENTMNLVN